MPYRNKTSVSEQAMPSKPDHQLVYLVYGRDTFYREARFSIVSALQRSRDPAALNIVVYTAQPDKFTDLPVSARPISDEDLTRWAGDIGYNHRSKPCLLKQVLGDADRTVLIDTDTFFRQAPELLFELVDDNTLLVDEILQAWRTADGGTLYRGLAPHLQEFRLDDGMPLINSGVIGVTRGHEQLLDDTIALIDKLYLPSGKTFTIEQIALGICAWNNYPLREQGEVLKHYWSRKQLFRGKIDAYLAMHHDELLGENARADLELVSPEHPKPGLLSRLGYKSRLLRFPEQHRHFLLELLYGAHPYENKFDRASREAWWDKAITNWQEKYGGDDERLSQLMASGALEKALGKNYPAFQDFVRCRQSPPG